MAVARKHHFVPQLYLRGFANDASQLFVVDASSRRSFLSTPANIAAERDYNRIDVEGIPPDALEKELAKLEAAIAPGIERIRANLSFNEDRRDREDAINLISLLAVRNPRTRKAMELLYGELFSAMLQMPFGSKERWEAVVAGMKEVGRWPEGVPANFEGHKKFVEENKDSIKPSKNFRLEMELEQLEFAYPYFDSRNWRMIKAAENTGGFITTDHPVCMHQSMSELNYGQQFAQGFDLAGRDILFPLSPTVALVGRDEGEEDIIEVGLHCVASFNATVMGYAMRQIYSRDDQYCYTRSVPQSLGKGGTLLNDPNLIIRED